MLSQFFNAPVTLVLTIALMATASFHFMATRSRSTYKNRSIEAYIAFCQAFDMVLYFSCMVTIFAFGYTYGLIETLKLIAACLAMPVIGMLFALVMGTKRWNIISGLVALPLAILCALYIFPRLNWFGFF